MILLITSAILFAISTFGNNLALNAIECLVAIFLLVLSINKIKTKLCYRLFVWGVTAHLVACYWLTDTLVLFGGFPYPLALSLFILFCIVSSIQLVLCGLLYKVFQRQTFLQKTLLAFPLAWALTEQFIPRLFPWHLALPLISWNTFSATASVLPLSVLSFIILWWFEILRIMLKRLSIGSRALHIERLNRSSLKIPEKSLIAISCLSFIAINGFGYWHNLQITNKIDASDKLNIAVIQANLDINGTKPIIPTYQHLIQEAKNLDAELLILPESAINTWMRETRNNYNDDWEIDTELIKRFNISTDTAFIFGGASFRDMDFQNEMYFNSVFGFDYNIEFAGLYHKKILMPFGEYLPYEKTFPSLRSFSPQSGNLDKGVIDIPIKIKVDDKRTISVGILICYEDLIPSLAKTMKNNGADILVNFTNDVWYGESVAQSQHNLLAMWRTVETGKYLVRATNTGLSSIISPLGKIDASIKPFQEGVLVYKVPLI